MNYPQEGKYDIILHLDVGATCTDMTLEYPDDFEGRDAVGWLMFFLLKKQEKDAQERVEKARSERAKLPWWWRIFK